MKILITFAILLSFFAGDYIVNPVPKPRHQFTVIAHRGEHNIYPENTIQAYQQAITSGVDYIEIDLRTSTDGYLVSMHDGSVDRTTDAKGLVKDIKLSQIQQLRIRAKEPADTTLYRVPEFEQILRLCKGKIYIYIDFKDASAAKTLALLKKYDMEKQVLIYINKPSQFTDWRTIDSTMPLMVSLPDNVKTVEEMKAFIQSHQPDVLDGNYNTYNKEMLTYALSLQLPVWPDAQSPTEGPAVWDEALSTGFKGLQTDNPARLVKYLRENNRR